MKINKIRVTIALIIGSTFLVPVVTFAAVNNQNKLMLRLLNQIAKQSFPGYNQPANPRMGYLDEGNQVAIPIKLTKGKKYGFAAVCDENCNDVDLSLKDANERLIQEDISEEDSAVVKYNAKKTGRYYLTVDMAACDDIECAYGVGLYRK